MKKMQSIMTGVAVLAALALPMTAMAGNKLVVQDNSTPAVDKFVVTDTGYVGVGTSAPDASLHIKATGLFPANVVKIEGNEVNKGGGIVAYLNRNDSSLNQLGDRLGFIFFGSNVGGTLRHPAGFAANAEENWTSGSWPAYFAFQTTPSGSTSRTERMRITASGNIGIGTTGPTALIDVNGDTIRLRTSKTPVSSTAACNQGDHVWDASYVYVCVATNTWKRAALASW